MHIEKVSENYIEECLDKGKIWNKNDIPFIEDKLATMIDIKPQSLEDDVNLTSVQNNNDSNKKYMLLQILKLLTDTPETDSEDEDEE